MNNNMLKYGWIINAIKRFSKKEGRCFAFTMLLLSFTLGVKANPVDMKLAREIGAKFISANTVMKVAPDSDLHWVATYQTTHNDAAFYVFNTPKGFVIVAADDCATPILGYSEEGGFDVNDVPIQMEEYLQGFVEQIQYGIDHHLSADETISRQWELVKTTGHITEQRSTTVVTPLLTDSWGQGCYYNNLCPEDENGSCGHTVVGCAATSMSQIMRYWGYPTTGIGSHSYTPSNYPTQTANFGATTYDWAHMPNSLNSSSSSTQVNAVATLAWHCGVSIDMNYGPSGSGAYAEDVVTALVNYFNYSTDLSGLYRNNYSDSEWLAMVKNSLDLGRPIHYSGHNSVGQGGHGFVCDGYDANDMLHFNWGWYGSYNNYFALNALTPSGYDFSYSNFAIFNIHPSCSAGTTYQVSVTTSPSNGGTVSGAGSYNCGDVCTLTAVPANGYMFCSWTEGGVVVSTEATYSFAILGSRNLVANFVAGDGCTLVFNLNDSFGDGWTGNALTVSYSEGCATYEELTFDSGTSATITRNVIDGSHIVLGWVSGSWVGECSFLVTYEDGTIIYEGSNLSDSFSYEFDVNCNGSEPSLPLQVVAQYYPDPSNPASPYVKVYWTNEIMGDVSLSNPGTDRSTYNIYRANCDGSNEQMIAENVTGDQYLDEGWADLPLGNYIYGVSEMDERGKAGEIHWNDSFVAENHHAVDASAPAHIIDDPGEPSRVNYDNGWLYYDNGSYATNVGVGESTVYWGIMFPTNILASYAGNNLSKVAVYENSYNTEPITLSIYLGGTSAPSTLVYTDTFNPLGNNAFHEVTLSTPVAISGTQNLWIVCSEYGTYPATASSDSGDPNGRWFSFDGNSWTDLASAGLSGYCWMIRGYEEEAEAPISWSNCIEKMLGEQSIDLVAGWNWFSTYVDVTLSQLKSALVAALPGTNITISSQNNGSTTYNGSIWRGTLNSLDVTQMYKIKTAANCQIVLTGAALVPAEHPITIHNGANWIGFPLNVSMSLNNAFAGFAVSGDMVRSKDGSATYTNQWRGTLNTLLPGQGYIYKSSTTGNRTLTFPIGAK